MEQRYIDKLRKVLEDGNGDTAMDYIEYDNILCEFLREMGYDKLADYYYSLEKWYA